MQVFKLYFKIFRRYFGICFMYMGIFIGVLSGIIVPQLMEQGKEQYTQSKCSFAVFDYDNSELSTGIVSYLENTHRLKTIADDDKETIQDELYATNVDAVIIINKGFEENFANEGEYLEVYTVPNTITAVLFEQHLNSYLSVVNTYTVAGFDMADALEKATVASETSIDVSLTTGEEVQSEGPLHHFYIYLAWVFVAVCVNSITHVLSSLDKKNIRNRIECSAYKFMRMNMEIVLAVVITGLAICGICGIVSTIMFPEDMLTVNGILYILNSVCIMAVALAITYLVSKVTTNEQVISLLSNVVGLGMAFLCGVFVPIEYLSDGVIKIAHFLPAYWNVRAIGIIDSFTSDKLGTLLSYMGIQLLFAVAITCVALIIARRKRVSNA